MTRYKLMIEYNGTGFSGWQRQDTAMTVQQCIEEAIEKFCQEKTHITAAGRTDAGVHALGQVAHVDLNTEHNCYKILHGINFHLRPAMIAITHIEEIDDKFHARFSAQKRSYIYRIINRQAPVILEYNRAWHVSHDLDINAMQLAANKLLGKHDFSSFRAANCQSKSPIKTLDIIDISQEGENITFFVEAPSFMYHMVRNLVGTLAEVGNGKRKPDDIDAILEAKDRKAAGPTAPAYGLYFSHVTY